MKLVRKLKAAWKWSTGYTLVIVSPTTITTVKHRIFHAPTSKSEKVTPSKLRGQSINMIIFDEYENLTPAQLKELESIEVKK